MEAALGNSEGEGRRIFHFVASLTTPCIGLTFSCAFRISGYNKYVFVLSKKNGVTLFFYYTANIREKGKISMPSETGETYECEICGSVVEVKEGGAGTLECCGQPMTLQE